MKSLLRGLFTAWAFLTRVPLPFNFKLRYSGIIPHSTTVGVLLSVPLFGVLFGINMLPAGIDLLPPAVFAILFVFLQYMMSNLFHFDGLLDSADAMLPYVKKHKRLEILKDPRSGSFAVWAGILVLLYRFAMASWFLQQTNMLQLAGILITVVAGARFAAGFTVFLIPPAKNEGLGFEVSKTSLFEHIAVGIFWNTGIAVLWHYAGFFWWIPLSIQLLSVILLRLTLLRSYKKKIDGFTGDTIGAGIEIVELVIWTVSVLCLSIF